MKRVIFLSLFFLPWISAAAAPDPRKAVEGSPGDTEAAVKHLRGVLPDSTCKSIFAAFDAGVRGPTSFAASWILALQRIGKVSVHSPEVKSAFTYEFLTALDDETRRHEALALYQRIAVANTDDPYWRLIRARCARRMDLPETPELYAQVFAEMRGVPPSDEIRQLWEANRKEFDLASYTKEQWAKQTKSFVYDATGPDVPGSPPIKGSPFPLLDVAAVPGSEAGAWATALEGSALTHTKAFDDMIAQAGKHGELPWLDGRGFLNAGHALTMHLLGKPPAELAALRDLQESGFQKAISKAPEASEPLALFRRYPWSESAQRSLLESARQALFAGEPQGAFRSFQDVLRHAETKELREDAQVGLWASLAQFAGPEALGRSFGGVDSEATWPWNGKRVKTELIRRQLAREAAEPQSPSLASLTPHTVHLPPARMSDSHVASTDMQRVGGQLLVSSENMLLMYDAANPVKPLWSHTRLLGNSSGAKYVLPQFFDKRIVASWGEGNYNDNPVVAFHGADGAIAGEGNPHDPYSRYRYRSMGSPVAIDGKVYAVQFSQPYLSIYGHQERLHWGDVVLSCFGGDLKHLWTRSYECAQAASLPPDLRRLNSVRPRINQGAVYFCTNDGHVIRADSRDGHLEWIHFYRNGGASPWCLGSAPIVTEDKVICMPKLTGNLFALDKETGRRIWTLPILRGHEVLGISGGQVLVVGPNTLYGVDVDTGEMRWGRRISSDYIDGFQLPRAQLIGSSVYTGTKNTLYRFDARNGSLLETRGWGMRAEVPMSFLIDGADLYAISDLPMKDEASERQLVKLHTALGYRRDQTVPVVRKDGSVLIWREGMLICHTGEKWLWGRFLTIDNKWGNGLRDLQNNEILINSSVHDSATGALLRMGCGRWPPLEIKIGGE
jgi:outer membrane protein assembly factor BamB